MSIGLCILIVTLTADAIAGARQDCLDAGMDAYPPSRHHLNGSALCGEICEFVGFVVMA